MTAVPYPDLAQTSDGDWVMPRAVSDWRAELSLWAEAAQASRRFRASVAHMRGIGLADAEWSLRFRYHVGSPEDVIAEQTTLAVAIARSPLYGVPETDKEAMAQFSIAVGLWTASPYLWLTDVWEELGRLSVDVPTMTVGDLRLGSGSAYWSLEDEQTFQPADSQPDGTPAPLFVSGGLLLQELQAGISWYRIASRVDGQDRLIMGGSIRPGDIYPDDFDEERRPHVARILAGLAFLESPYIPRTVRRMGRGQRRFFGFGRPEETDVTFVDLRPAANHEALDDSDADALGRDWKHRWIVRGHWRNQWFPSLGTHKLIYIPPHIKGPEDKPLKQTVYRVVR